MAVAENIDYEKLSSNMKHTYDGNFAATSYVYVCDIDGQNFFLKKINPKFHLAIECDVYEREVFILEYFEKLGISWAPKILWKNDQHRILCMTYCGEKINTCNIPDDAVEQVEKILDDLKKMEIEHNDTEGEILVLDGKIYICDFGWATYRGKLSCGLNIYDGENKCAYRPDSKIVDDVKKILFLKSEK